MEAEPATVEAVNRRASLVIGEMCDAAAPAAATEASQLAIDLERAISESSFRRSYAQLEIRPDRVKLDTGFRSLGHMNLWLWFLCNGNFRVLELLVASNNHRADEPAERRAGGGSKPAVSWRDSYFMYRMHQWVPGATAKRLALDFGISERTTTARIRMWAAVERVRLQAFGVPSLLEELGLRPPDDQFAVQFPNYVVVMHDTSDWRLLGKPSDHELSGLVANAYYGCHCLKIMVSTTCYGFLMAPPAPGGITDTLHLRANGVLGRQQALLEQLKQDPLAHRGGPGGNRGIECMRSYCTSPFLRLCGFDILCIFLHNSPVSQRR